jgi:hypothetical protein
VLNQIMRKIEGSLGRILRGHIDKAIMKETNTMKILTAKNLVFDIQSMGLIGNIQEAEFKVFSQYGDDGIIQYLINVLDIHNETFIEFGVENYTESNTRFLLINNNWSGLVIDGSQENIEHVKNDEIYWKYDLTAVHHFVTTDNINKIFVENGFSGEIGILSIDLDGNDYWVWQAIDVVKPVIVIIEYNSIFGKEYAVTVPYQEDFNRTKAHYSNLYWGCSLKALYILAESKGYFFIGCNSNGNNAYFVRKDKIDTLKAVSFEMGYVESKFRESRDESGRLTFISGNKRMKMIEDMIVIDIESHRQIKLNELGGNHNGNRDYRI